MAKKKKKTNKRKKYQQIRDEIDRMREVDNFHNQLNDTTPNEFQSGKIKVYTDLIQFINRLDHESN